MRVEEWIKTVNWKDRTERLSPSRFKALEEHFRRMVMWAEHLGNEEIFPFGDLASAWTDSLHVSVPDRDWTLLTKGMAMSTREKIMVENMAKWETLSLQQNFHPEDRLPDPYAPVRVFFERQGTLRFENGLLAFEGAMLPLKPRAMYRALTPLDLSKENLDLLDSKFA